MKVGRYSERFDKQIRQLEFKLEELERNKASRTIPPTPELNARLLRGDAYRLAIIAGASTYSGFVGPKSAPDSCGPAQNAINFIRIFRYMLATPQSREWSGDRIDMLQTMRLTEVVSIAEGRHEFLRDHSVAEDLV